MAWAHVIPINAGGQLYDVLVGRGLLSNAAVVLRRLLESRPARIAVVADSNVAAIYPGRLEESLREAGFEPISVTVSAGEESKSLATLSRICDALLQRGIERTTPIIGLGGGMTTDLAGFAAATLLRGLPYIPIPTSLLAMVDASIGGKTAINHYAGKNLIGAFHQPAAVLIDPDVLATLPPRELRNGLAEVIKHYVIRDAEGFARLEANMARVLELELDLVTEIITQNVTIKAKIVEADPFERGERAHLNFGHTFGHGFEHASSYHLSHGEAVALGMCAAAHAAVELGMLDEESRRRLIALIAAAGLPTSGSRLDDDAVLAAMQRDKKTQDCKMRLVLLERIGTVRVRDDVPGAVVRNAITAITR